MVEFVFLRLQSNGGSGKVKKPVVSLRFGDLNYIKTTIFAVGGKMIQRDKVIDWNMHFSIVKANLSLS